MLTRFVVKESIKSFCPDLGEKQLATAIYWNDLTHYTILFSFNFWQKFDFQFIRHFTIALRVKWAIHWGKKKKKFTSHHAKFTSKELVK